LNILGHILFSQTLSPIKLVSLVKTTTTR
jgi:hypothetical protein